MLMVRQLSLSVAFETCWMIDIFAVIPSQLKAVYLSRFVGRKLCCYCCRCCCSLRLKSKASPPSIIPPSLKPVTCIHPLFHVFTFFFFSNPHIFTFLSLSPLQLLHPAQRSARARQPWKSDTLVAGLRCMFQKIAFLYAWRSIFFTLRPNFPTNSLPPRKFGLDSSLVFERGTPR